MINAADIDASTSLVLQRDAQKLTMYFGERTRTAQGRFAADSLVDLFEQHAVSCGILLRGIEGFGLRHFLRSDLSLSLSEDPPAVAIAVDTKDRVQRLRDDVQRLDAPGVTTVERARLIDGASDTRTPVRHLHEEIKLTMYLGRAQRMAGTPAYRHISALMYERGLSGASAFLGVDGTSRGARVRAGFFHGNATVPLMLVAVGDGDRVRALIPELRRGFPEALLTVERVAVCKRDGVLLADPREMPEADADDRARWQKITVYTSEATVHDGLPIHRQLVRRLRSAGTAQGATTIRGLWGFHGDHRPRGDRLLQLQRRVPVSTIVIDTPEHIRSSFGIIDDVTQRHGLVTSETVPVMVSASAGQTP